MHGMTDISSGKAARHTACMGWRGLLGGFLESDAGSCNCETNLVVCMQAVLQDMVLKRKHAAAAAAAKHGPAEAVLADGRVLSQQHLLHTMSADGQRLSQQHLLPIISADRQGSLPP